MPQPTADSTITLLPAATPLNGSEPFPIDQVQSSVLTTVKATISQIRDYLNSLYLNQRLLQWTYSGGYLLTSVVRDTNDAASTATVLWPDGTTGNYTTDVASTAFPGAIDAYHITYNGTTTKTMNQPTVTRHANDGMSIQPAVTK